MNGLPTHQFLCILLRYYQIELHHLSMGGILHIVAFIMLCEAFLGILPYHMEVLPLHSRWSQVVSGGRWCALANLWQLIGAVLPVAASGLKQGVALRVVPGAQL
jgi:hypothetical protein